MKYGCKRNDSAIESAAKNGHSECMKWANNNADHHYYDLNIMATEYGQLDCLKYFINNSTGTDYICETTANNGHIDCLKWLIKIGCVWDERKFVNT